METGTNAQDAKISSISEFYKNKSILVTGVTGFVGKVLVEKLLRSCPDIKTIYVLLRAKKGVPVEKRLEQLVNNPIFDRVKRLNAESLTKLHAIEGDIGVPELGLSDANIELLSSRVNIVFHSAATVRFDEPLKLAVNINILGTRRVLKLCEKIKNLEALIHISTAYAHCTRFELEEKFYPSPTDVQKFIDTVDWLDAKLLDRITSEIIGKWPNTYTFTKALGEALVLEERGNLPVAIIRPSIVNSAWREPLPGWVDNMNGPTGMIVLGTKGILRTMVCGCDMVMDLVPVDIVTNLTIVVAWHTATYKPNEIRIYHAVSDPHVRVTWREWVRLLRPVVLNYPSQEMFRYPSADCTGSYIWYNLYGVPFQHIIPGVIGDTILYLTGKKPRVLKIYKKLHHAIDCLQYFTIHQWEFSKANVYALQNMLSEEDKEKFGFDMSTLHMPNYLRDNYLLGVRQCLLKEDESTLPLARKRLRRYYIATQVFNGIILFGVLRLVASQTEMITDLWETVSSSFWTA